MTEPAPPGIVEHVEAWFKAHFGRDVEDVKTDLEEALNFAEANGKTVADLAAVIKSLATALAPEAAPEVQALLGQLGEIAAKAEADLERFLGH